MTAEQFRPKFTTSASKQEERKEAREQAGHYFGARVSTSEGTKAPTNVKTPNIPFKAVRDLIAFEDAQKAQQFEIDENKKALRLNRDKWNRGKNGQA